MGTSDGLPTKFLKTRIYKFRVPVWADLGSKPNAGGRKTGSKRPGTNARAVWDPFFVRPHWVYGQSQPKPGPKLRNLVVGLLAGRILGLLALAACSAMRGALANAYPYTQRPCHAPGSLNYTRVPYMQQKGFIEMGSVFLERGSGLSR